jgi:hypothetical protein
MRSAGVLLTAAFIAALALGGCVAAEQSAPPRGVVVSGPPPAPLPEPMRPPPPSTASVWVDGYWHWTGMQYAWIPGHWESGPPGTTWAAPRYVASEGSYVYEAGGWRPAPPAPPVLTAAPAPPAHANALR